MDSANQLDRPSTPPPPPLPSPSFDHPSTPPTASCPTTTTQTTRDQRLQVQTLHDIGLPYAHIHDHLGLTIRQIHYALRHRLTP
jgi:hypothetical protein